MNDDSTKNLSKVIRIDEGEIRGHLDETVRGFDMHRAGAEKLLFDKALERYLAGVSASKRPSTAYGEGRKASALKNKFDHSNAVATSVHLIG